MYNIFFSPIEKHRMNYLNYICRLIDCPMCKRRLIQRTFRNIFGNEQSNDGSHGDKNVLGSNNNAQITEFNAGNIHVQSTSNEVIDQMNIVSVVEQNANQNENDGEQPKESNAAMLKINVAAMSAKKKPSICVRPHRHVHLKLIKSIDRQKFQHHSNAQNGDSSKQPLILPSKQTSIPAVAPVEDENEVGIRRLNRIRQPVSHFNYGIIKCCICKKKICQDVSVTQCDDGAMICSINCCKQA